MKTRNESDETIPGALTVWQALRNENYVYEMEEQDSDVVRKRIEMTFQNFERIMQRSLPRPLIVIDGKRSPKSPTRLVEDDLFRKLKRIESRIMSLPNASTVDPCFDEDCRERLRRVVADPTENGGFDFVLDLTGCNGGKFGSTGKDGTIRINTKTLIAIWTAEDVRQAAKEELSRGRWIVYAAAAPCDVKESTAKAIEFFHAIKYIHLLAF